MLKHRVKVIEGILSADDPSLIKCILTNILHDYTAVECPVQMQSIKSDVIFQMKLRNCHKEIRNLSEAIKLIQDGIILENATF